MWEVLSSPGIGCRLRVDDGYFSTIKLGKSCRPPQTWPRPVNTSAFVGTNPTDESITSGLPVIRPQSRNFPEREFWGM